MFERYWLAGMRKKLGLHTEAAEDRELIEMLLDWMQSVQADFTNTFDDLSAENELEDGLYCDERFQAWHSRWQQRLERDGQPAESAYALMRDVNPSVIPRNHRVEEALAAATEDDDLSVMHRLLEALSLPYERNVAFADYRNPPPPGSGRYRTFCGT